MDESFEVARDVVNGTRAGTRGNTRGGKGRRFLDSQLGDGGGMRAG